MIKSLCLSKTSRIDILFSMSKWSAYDQATDKKAACYLGSDHGFAFR
jgi:hypothetical protein